MKNYALLIIAATNVLSFNCLAQSSEQVPLKTNIVNAQLASNDVLAYREEEKTNVKLGNNLITYDVTTLSLVKTNDLGENKSRIEIPKDAKSKMETPKANVKTVKSAVINPKVKPTKEAVVPVKKVESVQIDVTKTYERVMDKGYKSAAMLKKVADMHFFDGDLVKAAKWYSELFAMATDLEAVYYYRYGESLKAIGENEKSNEMMKLFETKRL